MATAALSRFIVQLFQPVQPMLADSAADVERRCDARRGGVRIQARWRAHPGAQGGRRGPGLLARPARRDGRGARGRRGRARIAGRELDSRRRGDRAAAPTARRSRFRSRCAASAASSMSTGCAQSCRCRRSSSTACISTATPLIDEPLAAPRRRCSTAVAGRDASCRAS